MEKKFYICLESTVETAGELAASLREMAIKAIKDGKDDKAMLLMKMVATVKEEMEADHII